MRPSLVVTAVIGMAAGVIAASSQPVRDLFNEIYPSDFIKRHVLNLCESYDLGFDRLDPTAREECYRGMPKAAPDEAHARLGLMANQLDLRQAADRRGVPGNDIRVIEETEAVRGGISR